MIVNKKSMDKKIDWEAVDSVSQDDYDEAPELTQEMMRIAFISKPKHKKAVSLRIDEDIIEFFKRTNDKYQTKINDVLRAYKTAFEKMNLS